jgi:hypothetical protein
MDRRPNRNVRRRESSRGMKYGLSCDLVGTGPYHGHSGDPMRWTIGDFGSGGSSSTSKKRIPCLLRRGINPPKDPCGAVKKLRDLDDVVTEAGTPGVSSGPQEQGTKPNNLMALGS